MNLSHATNEKTANGFLKFSEAVRVFSPSCRTFGSSAVYCLPVLDGAMSKFEDFEVTDPQTFHGPRKHLKIWALASVC